MNFILEKYMLPYQSLIISSTKNFNHPLVSLGNPSGLVYTSARTTDKQAIVILVGTSV
jgi:hypothetical protein